MDYKTFFRERLTVLDNLTKLYLDLWKKTEMEPLDVGNKIKKCRNLLDKMVGMSPLESKKQIKNMLKFDNKLVNLFSEINVCLKNSLQKNN